MAAGNHAIDRGRRGQSRRLVWYLAGAAVLGLLLANAHLIYVAVVSQPDCVPHLKESGRSEGGYRAAGSAC
ncbi:MAG: hypothetical protein AB7F08_01480 [Dongiaceae bacterium]